MIKIPTSYLKAALCAAGKKDIRYYLNGIFIEQAIDGTRVVATDGAIICVIRHESENPTVAPGFIVPREVVEAAVKAKMKETTFEPHDKPGQWIMNGTHLFNQVDGRYPEYRRVFYKQVTNEASVFNPFLLAEFGKMAQALGKRSSDVTFHQNGQASCMVSIVGVPEFAGVLMPMNLQAKDAPVRPGVAQWV